jgi:hypothetical protein
MITIASIENSVSIAVGWGRQPEMDMRTPSAQYISGKSKKALKLRMRQGELSAAY